MSKNNDYTLYEVETSQAGDPPSEAPSPGGGRRLRWGRIALWAGIGLFVLVAAVLGGSYLWFRGEVVGANSRVSEEIRAALEATPSDQAAAATEDMEPPSGMNLLLLGSDRRDDDTSLSARSDTIMVVHIDPDLDFLSILSLPRDLQVEIEGHGQNKLNTAYAFGGPALTIKTVQGLTGLDIDHYLEIGFSAFEDITDSLGGIYVDVDRPYFNDSTVYEKIDIAAGYQLLNGADALDYVRFRRDQNADLGRMARQQRFMVAVREQAMGWNLPFKLPGLVSALFDNLVTDLGSNDILKLAYWGVRLDGDRIRQITVMGENEWVDGLAYVVLEEGALEKALTQLQAVPGEETKVAAADSTDEGSPDVGSTAPSVPTDASPAGIPDAAIWHRVAEMVPFPVRAPSYLPGGYAYAGRTPADGPTYAIRVDGGSKPAFRMMYRRTSGEGVHTDSYMGITQTTWTDAPAAGKGKKVEHDGTVFTIVGTKDKVERIWWKADGVLYWVANTVTYALPEEELLAVAMSMIPIPAE